ncbi:MAG: PIN domain-containing protein [Saccharofermentans sp.]|nr:PIN domain-containing protein [Saccharofermentans sp.]
MKWLRNIVDGYILDANYICRYLLADQQEQFVTAKDLIDNYKCSVKYEILEEVVYVLERLYQIPRNEIKTSLISILDRANIHIKSRDVVNSSLIAYSDRPKLDFVDCLLYGYYKSGYKVATFDRKLQKKLNIV